jgi:hypothetical protein
MGNYNPHRPTVLGQEWAPLNFESATLDPDTEIGSSFVLETSTTVVSGSFFVDDLPPNQGYKVGMVSVYERGQEALSGPIKRVLIPVNAVTLTPDGANGTATIVGGTGPQALATPYDSSLISVQGTVECRFNFAVNAATELTDKRIVDVNIVMALAGTEPDDFLTAIFPSIDGPGSNNLFYDNIHPSVRSVQSLQSFDKISLGNTNLFHASFEWGVFANRFPWRYPDLQRFESGAGNGLTFVINTQSLTAVPINDLTLRLSYMVLEVLYCEETRLMYGGRGGPFLNAYTYPGTVTKGQNVVQLRPVDTFGATGKTLTPGEYTVTVTNGDLGNNFYSQGGTPAVRALRQKYALPSHDAIQLKLTRTVDSTFSLAETEVLPRVTLHTASAVVTGVHDYDELTPGTVYGSIEVQPDVVQRSGGAAVAYPQVRFYARHFGSTNVPLTLVSTTQATWLVRITPEELDALPEIVDGWREVTLRFPDSATPTFSDAGTTHTWRWSATGLDAGSRWEVLTPYGASATTAPYDTSAATYGGATAFTQVGASVLNNDADATLIFSQDPGAVTGLAVEILQQSLEPIGEECDEAACVPTALYYHHLTWNARDVLDGFEDRDTTDGWDEADSGQIWSHENGSIDDYYVTEGAGVIRVDTVNVIYFSKIDAGTYNVEVRGRFRLPVVPTGSGISVRVTGRLEDSGNYLEGQLLFNTSGTVQLLIGNRVGGIGANLSPTILLDGNHVAGDVWNLALRLEGSTALAMAWRDEAPEPSGWQAVAPLLAGSLSVTGTQVSAGVRAEAGNLDTPFELEWLDFSATSLDVTAFELQRQDDVDDEWQTIMLSTGTAVREFNDYEARVGELSRYRMRTVNVLEFYGAWTASGAATSTLTAPGVVGAGDGNSVMIFTTNEHQDGTGNLAYTMVWDSDVTEEFTFPEAGDVQLRDLFRRDFPLAFRPLERGGERFTRDMLVQNAAVPSGRLRDGFTSLRDLAWADVSYVCVRNELGDRWFSTVLVPSGRIRRNRRLYVARVEIVEVTDTPSVVDPAETP